MTATAKTKTTPEAPKPVEITRDNVKVNLDGFVFRQVMVRMPPDTTADDLRDPKIWRKAQLNVQSALRKYDAVFVLGHDESWYARAIVKHVDSESAHLTIEKVGSFREESEALYSDGKYEVYWDGQAYGVRRIADHVRVIGQGFTSPGLAVAAIRRELYPKVVN